MPSENNDTVLGEGLDVLLSVLGKLGWQKEYSQGNMSFRSKSNELITNVRFGDKDETTFPVEE